MAGGNFGGGTGTVLSPFLIEDAVDLNAIRNQTTGKYFKLVNDIDLSLEALNAVGLGANGAGWSPLQHEGRNCFNGSFNFNFHKITNLYINRPNEDGVGLFKRFAYDDVTGKFIRPRIEGVNITGGNYVGALVGEVGWRACGVDAAGTIESVSVIGGSISGTDYVGGVIGGINITRGGIIPLFKDIKVDISNISGIIPPLVILIPPITPPT
jgi:hypothetical protein